MTAEQGANRAGVMMPLASLPSEYGVGDMGPSAYRFVDMLADCGASFWQILPVNPLGYGNSPYQPYSSFAGDPLFISPDRLQLRGLLPVHIDTFQPTAGRIDYEGARAHKEALLAQAYDVFVPDETFRAFARTEWAEAYAVFMAFKRHSGMRPWQEWPAAQRDWPTHRDVDLAPFADTIAYELFLQYMFWNQWETLKAYANEKGIHIIGDIPIYVGLDSADVWLHRENFLLDVAGEPTVVAGVPPDYFSATGQRWGNPIYDWAHMQRDGFQFWVERLRHCARLFDVVRIDHFRAFDTYWEIPASCSTAVEGVWKEAPGYALFDTVLGQLPQFEIIAEDLGMLRDEVYVLRDHYHFKGMHILQFTFDPAKAPDPAASAQNMVAYTGTHDNDTMLGWYRSQPLMWRLKARWRLRRAGYRGEITRRFVRLALDDAAAYAIIPLPDILGLGAEGRINTPGTVGSPNWEWKLASFDRVPAALSAFGAEVRASGRARD